VDHSPINEVAVGRGASSCREDSCSTAPPESAGPNGFEDAAADGSGEPSAEADHRVTKSATSHVAAPTCRRGGRL